MRARQAGLTLPGLIAFLAVAGFAWITTVKCVPAWTEYFTILRVLHRIETEGDTDIASARRSFQNAAIVDRINSITAEDIVFQKTERGMTGFFEYEVRIHMLGNLDALFTFRKR